MSHFFDRHIWSEEQVFVQIEAPQASSALHIVGSVQDRGMSVFVIIPHAPDIGRQ
jgi:hypothetical protein